jgi:GAF domain-containing protein
VLQGVLTKAAELCGGEAGSITLNEGEGVVRYVASYGPAMLPYIGTTAEHLSGVDISVFTSTVEGIAHVDDFAAAVAGKHPYFEELTKVADVRTYTLAQLTSGGATAGALHMYRHEVRPFSEAEQTRLASFAAQASLAIGNARLFNDLDHALERQRAMTDVLEAVGMARTDIQPVLDRVVDHAQRLCDDTTAFVTLRDLDVFVAAAAGPASRAPDFDNTARKDPGRNTTTGELYATGRPVHIRDWDLEPPERFADSAARKSGLRSMLSLPLRRHDQIIGAFSFAREAAGGFSDSEMSLLQAFTDQASIAVNNARLLHEIEERNAELSESLELQTATSDILRLISANPGTSARCCKGSPNVQRRSVMPRLRIAAAPTRRLSFVSKPRGLQLTLGRNEQSLLGREFVAEQTINRRARDTREPVFLDDFQEVRDPVGMSRSQGICLISTASPASPCSSTTNGSATSTSAAPRCDRSIRRSRPIMQAFADQAAIAVANAKLFNDLDAALERQTAMTEVLDAVSQARLDLQPVFDKVAEHADRLCQGTGAMVLVREATVCC